MAVTNEKITSAFVRGRFPDVTNVPGTNTPTQCGPMTPVPFRVEKDTGETNLDKVLVGIATDQIYICFGGSIPYEILEFPVGFKHPTLAEGRLIHKLPSANTPLLFADDGGDNGRKKITSDKFGIIDILIRDKNNYKKSGEIIVDLKVRDVAGAVVTNINIPEGTTTKLTFYAGWRPADITWTNPSASDLEFYPEAGAGPDGAGPVARIKGLQESGPHVINIAGKQGTIGQVTINVTAPPP